MTDEPTDGLRVNDSVVIPRDELSTRALSEEQRERVLQKLSSRLDSEQTVRVVASDRRSQRQNRESAEERLAELVRTALLVPKKRRATKPSRAAKQARLDSKKRLSNKKRERRWDGD